MCVKILASTGSFRIEREYHSPPPAETNPYLTASSQRRWSENSPNETYQSRPFQGCYPAEHWVRLRTTNPIESTFATVRHRTKVTKGPGSRDAGLAMAFKLIESAQDHWRMVNAPHLVALVRAGATFTRGKLVERAEDAAA